MHVTNSGKKCLGVWRRWRHLTSLIEPRCWSGKLHTNLPLSRVDSRISIILSCVRMCALRWGTIIGLKQLVIGQAHKSRKRASSLALSAALLLWLATAEAALGHNWWALGEREREREKEALPDSMKTNAELHTGRTVAPPGGISCRSQWSVESLSRRLRGSNCSFKKKIKHETSQTKTETSCQVCWFY